MRSSSAGRGPAGHDALSWAVAKVPDGENVGAWMTIAVSPPIPAGEAI